MSLYNDVASPHLYIFNGGVIRNINRCASKSFMKHTCTAGRLIMV